MRRNASHLSHTARCIYLTGMGSRNQRLSGCQRRLAGRNSTDCHLEWRADNRGLLTEDELEIAYGYSVKVMEHMVDFWYDKDMESINMWEHGRKTDNYRNKYRILGENLSLSMQMVNSYEHWVKAGYKEKSICGDYAEKLQKLPSHMYVPFAKGEYDRGMSFWYAYGPFEHGGSLEQGSGPAGNRDRNHLDHPVSGLRKRRIES